MNLIMPKIIPKLPVLPGGISRAKTFGLKVDAELSTLITSRKCYPSFHGTEMLLDLEMTLTRELLVNFNPLSTIAVVGGEGTMEDVEYSLDGGAWTSAAGVWGTSKYIQVRGTSSPSYSTALSANIEIGGYSYLFYVTTRAAVMLPWEDASGNNILDAEGNVIEVFEP